MPQMGFEYTAPVFDWPKTVHALDGASGRQSVNFFSLALQPPWALTSSFSFVIILQKVGLLGRVISSLQAS
jgi:hypothetical protein